MQTLPLVRIEVELEGATVAYKVNIPTERDDERMGHWFESRQELRELVDWINRWHGEGKVNPPAVESDYVADPFAVSGQS